MLIQLSMGWQIMSPAHSCSVLCAGERAAALALAPSGTGLAIQRRQSSSQVHD